jgi:hypothetical protein
MDPAALDLRLEEQDGVITRRQLLAIEGFAVSDLQRMVRRRELSRVHRGVYVNHTGPLTRRQQEWAAILFYAPAALSHESADPAVRASPGDPIHVSIDASRFLQQLDGVVLHRVRGLQSRVVWTLQPPRMHPDEVVLTLADEALTEQDVVSLVCRALQRRRTTAARLAGRLDQRSRMRRRAWLRRLLTDLADGTCSVLEHGYLTRVERAHGLPRPQRQVTRRPPAGTEYRDVEYLGRALVIELDGKAFHDSTEERENDYERVIDDVIAARATVRLTWGQVYRRPCRTAGKLGMLLQQRGWRGAPEPCGPDCELRRDVAA